MTKSKKATETKKKTTTGAAKQKPAKRASSSSASRSKKAAAPKGGHGGKRAIESGAARSGKSDSTARKGRTTPPAAADRASTRARPAQKRETASRKKRAETRSPGGKPSEAPPIATPAAPAERPRPARQPHAKAATAPDATKPTTARAAPTSDAPLGSAAPPTTVAHPPSTATETATESNPSPAPGVDADVAAQIRELEARLGGMIRDAATGADEDAPASLREQVSFAAREVVDRLAAPVERPGHDDSGVVDAVRGLLSSDYYLRQWGRIGMRNRSEEVDDFGLDAVYERRLQPLWDFLYKRYFRVETAGIENIPSDGRCLVVANHSGTIPLDGVMLRACIRIEHPAARELRWLSEDFIYHLPFVGAFMSRIGAVRACQENAQRLLSKDALVAVFPEGVKGIGKLYRDRYRLQRFGRGGFIRLCLRSQTPLVPCAVIGAEEASPMLYRDEFFSRALGLPYLPITPTFPWLGPMGLIPAPTKWRVVFGEPIEMSDYDPSDAEDHVLVGRLAERVRSSIQQMVDVGVGQRRSVWAG